jgi:hypothetical protein
VDGENRGEHDRAVVRALQSLAATTSPTAAERQRIRDRILLALEDAAEEDLPSAQASSPTAGAHDDVPTPRHGGLTDASQPRTTGATDVAADRSPTTDPAAESTTADPAIDPPTAKRTTANPVAGQSTTGRATADTPAAEHTTARPAAGRSASDRAEASTDPTGTAAGKHTAARPTAHRSTTSRAEAHPGTDPTDTTARPTARRTTTSRAEAHPGTDPTDTTARPALRRTTGQVKAGPGVDPTGTAAGKHTTARPAAHRSTTGPSGERTTAGGRSSVRPATKRGGGVRDQTRPRSPEPGQRSVPSGSNRGETGRRGVLAGVRGRFAVAAVAVLALVGSLVGMSVLLARDALPGDALYGVKRTAEAAELGLTFGDEPKALKHLEFAASRVSEIETLARRYPNPDDAPVGSYLTALTDFDHDATAGSRQLIILATSTDGRLLVSLRDWSTQQATRLQAINNRLPEAARNRQAATRGLLERITARADALLARMDCYQITSGSFDDIGALPATGQCADNLAPTSGNTAPPSVPATPDNSGPATGTGAPGGPLPPAEPTPEVPPVPVPGATASVPPATRPSTPSTSTSEAPPILVLPPLLPGLPTLTIG